MVGVFTNNHKIRFLFFGNLSYAKGIDIVIDVFTKLSLNLREKVELVIAGKNVENIDFSIFRSISAYYKVFDRHINDDELIYLYSNTDVILLPYRKIMINTYFD